VIRNPHDRVVEWYPRDWPKYALIAGKIAIILIAVAFGAYAATHHSSREH
jgi:hypothetical protein